MNSLLPLIFFYIAITTAAVTGSYRIPFPPHFQFGAATAAYQIEGAWNEDGKGLNIWDVFSHKPNTTARGENGDVADDHYHKVAEDVELMRSMGLRNYRMSISWARILPDGTLNKINHKGINHYRKEIEMLNNAGIDVYVTLYHWDLPQNLDEKFGGWLNTTVMPKIFADYAEICFKSFGDRVKHWITFNEPWVTAIIGYGTGINAPGRCTGCKFGGNSAVEPYIVAHTQLLAHAAAVQVYRTKYQGSQNGKIGITLNTDWNEPLTDSQDDRIAAQRYQEFQLGWFSDPVIFGDYPASMKERVGQRLPIFTDEEKKSLRGSLDFLGLNHYTSKYVSLNKSASIHDPPVDWSHDIGCIAQVVDKDGKQIGPMADSSWLYVVPWGMRKILNWIKNRYDNIPVYITENGVDSPGESDLPIQQALNDTFRLNYLQSYITEVSKAVNEDKCNVQAYFVWSLMDNFEWADGYSKRFGIHYVDYSSPDKIRYRKQSTIWYSQLIREHQNRLV